MGEHMALYEKTQALKPHGLEIHPGSLILLLSSDNFAVSDICKSSCTCMCVCVCKVYGFIQTPVLCSSSTVTSEVSILFHAVLCEHFCEFVFTDSGSL